MSPDTPVTRILEALHGLFDGGPGWPALLAAHGERLGLIADDGGCGLLVGEGKTVADDAGDGIAVALDSLQGVSAETAGALVGSAVLCRFRPMRLGRRMANGFRAKVADVRKGGDGALQVLLRPSGKTLFVPAGACGEEPPLEAPTVRIRRGMEIAGDRKPGPGERKTVLVNISSAGVRFSIPARSEAFWREGDAVVVEVALPGEGGEPPVLRGVVRTVERRDGREIVGVRFEAERNAAESGWRQPGARAGSIDEHTRRLMRDAAKADRGAD